ncbi:hypothetical protein CDAR_501341 [Caerostris darwini]|uniref:Uncharacterized protein n=1 Tax=Caerostris darwini TaxID=1538125 RepID=A0AAV4R6N9_9ARAC|nr:hypothetical protein CDAR_501341 [Caerostris darwini]
MMPFPVKSPSQINRKSITPQSRANDAGSTHFKRKRALPSRNCRKILIREQQNVIDGQFCQIFPINVALVKQPPNIKQINDDTAPTSNRQKL